MQIWPPCCSDGERLITAGVVTSPNFPDNYPNNLEDTQTIEVEGGLTLLLEFTAFDLENQSTCRYDHLTITDGDGTILMKKSCGSSMPAEIRSRSNIVNVVFHTDRSGTRSGWSLSWRVWSPPGGKIFY